MHPIYGYTDIPELRNFLQMAVYVHFRKMIMDDIRFTENQTCLDWLKRWETQVKCTGGVSPKDKGRMFLSQKTKFDVFCMIVGYNKYCITLLQMFPRASISACLTNQDRLENFFGEQRASNGQADNPTIMQTGNYI